jgi:hypothetical protein
MSDQGVEESSSKRATDAQAQKRSLSPGKFVLYRR